MGSKSAKKRKKARRQRAKRLVLWLSCILITAIALGICTLLIRNRSDFIAQPSDIVDEGLVRVFLRSISGKPALGLTLDGVYTVDGDAGFRFARGTEVSVASEGGELYLSAGGLTIDMGSSFTLKRHAPEDGAEPGGLYIHESEKDNLFLGDLNLSSTGSGVDCILTIQVEDYLYGVVAYEMSNSFPLEALKAQAIAARTYAMRAASANKSKTYDLVDTTADQVFKGFDAGLENVIKAVDSTRGIVGMAGGSFAQCYYTASNGGQIASTKQIWGGTVSYIEMKDDPYDLENSLSSVKRGLIPTSPESNSALNWELISRLDPLIPDAQQLRIDEITSVTLVEPDVPGSLMYKAAQIEMRVSKRVLEKAEAGEADPAAPDGEGEPGALPDDSETPSPDATPETPQPTAPVTATPLPAGSASPDPTVSAQPEDTESPEPTPSPTPENLWVLSDWQALEESVTLRVETYGCLKALLNIGINSQPFEVFSVEKAENGFYLVARRFGHGVGMSQRGAQIMASKHHKDCEEILSFYYPGASWYQIDWTEHKLEPLSALPASLGYARAKPTPRPTQQPLRALKEGEYYAGVTATTLNVRSSPNTSSAIKALLYSGERVIVTGSYPDNWVSIVTQEFEGYVKADYLKKE